MPGWERVYVWPLLQQIGLGFLTGGDRAAFNPFDSTLDLSSAGAWAFLAVRFVGLVAVVPLIEEFFLRGFVMRFVMERDWWNVPFGKANTLAIVLGTALPILSHPEWIAAAVWFSMITWLMLRTRNIWDCVAAHAITNLILGVYVVARGGDAWQMM
jgi:CAAX prenyl protease-like protein